MRLAGQFHPKKRMAAALLISNLIHTKSLSIYSLRAACPIFALSAGHKVTSGQINARPRTPTKTQRASQASNLATQ